MTQAIERAGQGQGLAQRRELTLDQVCEMTGYEPAQVALVARTVAIGAPLVEIAMFLHSCRTLQLDPLLRQAYWIRRRQPDGTMKGGLQVGIDGFRSLADRQGNYAGSEPPAFRGQIELTYKGKRIYVPEKASVSCWKIVQGHKAMFTGEARWTEFYPGDEQGFMWRKMPFHQLAKCAEAQALRKGWPALLGAVQLDTEADGEAQGEPLDVTDLPEVAPRQTVVEQPRPERRQGTAADYRFIEEEYAAQDRNWQPDPETEPEPEAPDQGEKVAPELGADIERNQALIVEAQKLGITGLGKFTANATWPVEHVEKANEELGKRILAKSGDAAVAKQQEAIL